MKTINMLPVALLDDFAPAYQKPAPCPYKKALELAQSELLNAQRTGDTHAAALAAGRVVKRQGELAAHARKSATY